MAVRAFAARHGAPAFAPGFAGEFLAFEVAGQTVGLLLPATFMNRSGASVAAAREAHPHLDPADMLVVHDDLDLPLGRLRLRGAGGPGGQRGLASVIEALGTREVPRLRVGIGRPPDGVAVVDWVLSDFDEADAGPLREVLGRAVGAIDAWLGSDLDRAMERVNRAPDETAAP